MFHEILPKLKARWSARHNRPLPESVHFITRIKINAAIEYQTVFTDGHALRDRLVKIGSGTKKTLIVTLRLIEVRVGKVWCSYLTSVLEPEILPPYVVIDLYQKRWRIEREGRWGFPMRSGYPKVS